MNDTAPPRHMVRRSMAFEYPEDLHPHWKAASPEFSQMVNGLSLAMPFLEPYLIRTMGQAKREIADPEVLADMEDYIAQESEHFQQHHRFNAILKARGYACIAKLEEKLKADYTGFSRNRSLKFNVAYAEGFESMALALGHMLVERRRELFGGADPAVSSLILWHFVEEIEHKTVTFNVYKALYTGYFYRIYGLLFATLHIFGFANLATRELLREDGRWPGFKTRMAAWWQVARILAWLLPKFARILKPGYDPAQVSDPDWARAWAALYAQGEKRLTRLDTDNLTKEAPALAS